VADRYAAPVRYAAADHSAVPVRCAAADHSAAADHYAAADRYAFPCDPVPRLALSALDDHFAHFVHFGLIYLSDPFPLGGLPGLLARFAPGDQLE